MKFFLPPTKFLLLQKKAGFLPLGYGGKMENKTSFL